MRSAVFLSALVRRTYDMPDEEQDVGESRLDIIVWRMGLKCLAGMSSGSATKIMAAIRQRTGEKPSILRVQGTQTGRMSSSKPYI